jgi:hypothetical protein
MEDGKVLLDMRTAKYALATEHGKCTLHLWGEERNLVRRVSAADARGSPRTRSLRLTVHRFGQTRPSSLDLLGDADRRTPSTREATRTRYLLTLERVMLRGRDDWGNWKADGFRTAMDLEKSFGPAYARGSLVQGQQAWAVIAVNATETQATVDGILTLGVLSGERRRAAALPRTTRDCSARHGGAHPLAPRMDEPRRRAVGALGAR